MAGPISTYDGVLWVRAATTEDQAAIKRVVFTVLEEFGIGADPCGQQDEDLDNLARWYPPPRGVFELIQDGAGRILGCGGIHPLDQDSCELRKLYFLPVLRGRGAGSALLDRLVHFAKRAGFRRMELETASVLDLAIAMYHRRGFKEIHNKRDVARCDRAFELELSSYCPPKQIAVLQEIPDAS